jgi:hypothetical protein
MAWLTRFLSSVVRLVRPRTAAMLKVWSLSPAKGRHLPKDPDPSCLKNLITAFQLALLSVSDVGNGGLKESLLPVGCCRGGRSRCSARTRQAGVPR